MTSEGEIKRRQLPKLMACMTKASLENMRSKTLYHLNTLDAKAIRRRKFPLHECLILELREAGYAESSDYLQDLIYDNVQLVAADDIGIVIDLRKRHDYLEHIRAGLQKAETERDKGNTKKECLGLLKLAMFYAEKGKGLLWLAEKFYLAAIAVSSQYMLDGGRQKACCKYHYAKFLLDKFPGEDTEEPFKILTEVRDNAIGKDWLLYEPEDEGQSQDTVFAVTAVLMHGLLLDKAKCAKKEDPAKAERLARLAERRAKDANDIDKLAEAIVEMGNAQLKMNNLRNAQKTLERAFKIYSDNNNIEGLCDIRMHLAAVMQKLGDNEMAAKLLTEMGALAMEHNLRRQLGQALHLLGELHLKREKPELGTEHLAEAFTLFMGISFDQSLPAHDMLHSPDIDKGDFLFKSRSNEIFEEEAEQARLMMAISAGQELMASYFNLLREAGVCSVAQMKTIEWQLSHVGWWVETRSDDLIPCLCKTHNRTPLDILRMQISHKESRSSLAAQDSSEGEGMLGRTDTTEDIRTLRSSFPGKKPNDEAPNENI